MDPDDLRREVVDWVEDGVISPEQARRILARYDVDPPDSLQRSIEASAEAERSRIVTAVALMGGLLVTAGIGLYVATAWEDIPRLLRAVILLAVPIGGFFAATRLLARRRPRVGHGVWFASAAFVGVTVFLLGNMYAPGTESEWLFFGWTAVAVAAGHAYPSRPTTALGLLLSGALVVDVAESLRVDPVIPAGTLGVILFVVGAVRLDPEASDSLDGIYRLVGFGFAVLGVLAIAASSSVGSFPDAGGALGALLISVAAVAVVAFGGLLARRGTPVSTPRGTSALWAGGALLALGIGVLFVRYGDAMPELVAVLATHAVSLSVLVGGVVVGYVTDARGIVNAVALGFLLQLLFFLEATIGDVLPQSLALVIAGIVLLAAAFGLERGRRRLFARMGR